MTAFRAGTQAAAHRCVAVLAACRVADDGDAIRRTLREWGEGDPVPDAEIAELRATATQFDALARARDAAGAAVALNELLSDCRAPRLSSHDGTTEWHLHIDSSDRAPWTEWFVSSSALALASLLAETQRPPLGVCHATGCTTIYLTHAPGRHRQYCSSRCATRARVAAHRAMH